MNDGSTQKHLPFGTEWALKRMFDLALPHMSKDELQTIASSASDHSRRIAQNFATVLEGIGFLILADKDAGNFQSERDVPDLLFHAAEVMREIAGLQYMAAEAALALSS